MGLSQDPCILEDRRKGYFQVETSTYRLRLKKLRFCRGLDFGCSANFEVQGFRASGPAEGCGGGFRRDSSPEFKRGYLVFNKARNLSGATFEAGDAC